MKKKIIAILMAGCMTCSLAACGSDEGEKGKEGKEKITFVLDWTLRSYSHRRTEQTPLSLRGKRSLEFLFRIRWHLE